MTSCKITESSTYLENIYFSKKNYKPAAKPPPLDGSDLSVFWGGKEDSLLMCPNGAIFTTKSRGLYFFKGNNNNL